MKPQEFLTFGVRLLHEHNKLHDPFVDDFPGARADAAKHRAGCSICKSIDGNRLAYDALQAWFAADGAPLEAMAAVLFGPAAFEWATLSAVMVQRVAHLSKIGHEAEARGLLETFDLVKAYVTRVEARSEMLEARLATKTPK